MYPIIINFEKFSVFRYIKNAGLVDIKDCEAVCKEAWAIWGTELTQSDCKYISSHFEHLEKEFRE